MAHHYISLREKYPNFIYHSYSYASNKDGFKCEFHFEIEGLCTFSPSYFIPSKPFLDFKLKKAQLDILVFHIGMIELISYWKSCCCPKVIVKPAILNEEAVLWWKHLYFQGLGEFFYLNGIRCTLENFMTIQNDAKEVLSKQTFEVDSQILVPVGGGKDSVVTLELLKSSDHKIRPFIINPRHATLGCAKVAGYSENDILEVNRNLDTHILKLNAQGFLNGHTPFSAMLAFVSLLVCSFSKSSFIALSNEGSANEATVLGSEVNHQYSKSYQFENDFRIYCEKYISSSFHYFSFLRPLHEITIVRLFSKYPQYFDVFKSCNVGSKVDIWCGKCSKCLFAYIILAPFVSLSHLYGIFGKNLLNDQNLESIFLELIGLSASKPFECVGTVDEVLWSLHTIIEQKRVGGYLLTVFKSSQAYSREFNPKMIEDYSSEHFIPTSLETILKNAIA